VLAVLMPDEPEVYGLLALMMIHHARRRARFSGEDLVLLDDQDRSLWDTDQITAGRAVLDRAIALGGRGAYVVQAAIASLQTREDRLAAVAEQPARRGWSNSPAPGRRAQPRRSTRPPATPPQPHTVDRLDLHGYLLLPLHLRRAATLSRPPRRSPERPYRRALDPATTTPERRFLTRRLEQL
jgi:RNA polymerase sigma-70 factor (ECF subfamily)